MTGPAEAAGPIRHRLEPPIGVTREYPRAEAGIDPDPSKGWLRRIAPVVMAHKVLFFGSIALALVANLAQVALPAVVRETIDRALAGGATADDAVAADRPGLLGFVIVLLALGVIRALLTMAYRYGLYRTAFEIDTDLRTMLYEHLSTLSFSFYDRTHSGQVISRANSDIRSVQMFLTFAPLISMTSVMFFVALIYMLSIHVWLTLVAIAPLPGVYLLGKRLRDQVFPLSWIVQARVADVSTIVDENINGVRVVRSFAAERQQITELAKAATRLRWAGVRTVDARARHNPIIENLPRIGMLGVLVYGGWLVIEGDVTEGTLFAFTAYVTMLQAPFRTLGLFLMLGQRARASAARIYEIFDTEPEIVDAHDAIELDGVSGRITFDNVRFSYRSTGDPDPAEPSERDDGAADQGTADQGAADQGAAGPGADTEPAGTPILNGFDLEIEPGETVALVGRTGSGKSTVAKLLTRFYDVDGGAIRIDGHDVREVTQLSLRRAVGMVADEPFLFSISLADNIAYGDPTADRDEIVAAATLAEADGFVSGLPGGYDEVVGERGYTLSGGQRQRVALARAALVEPPIMVLDDATSALDVHVEEAILAGLATPSRFGAGDGNGPGIGVGPDDGDGPGNGSGDTGGRRTTILIAHRLSTIAAADRVVLLEGGRVRASGRHSELMATESAYAEVLANLDDGTGGIEAGP